MSDDTITISDAEVQRLRRIEAEVERLRARIKMLECPHEALWAQNERLRAVLERIEKHPHATGEIRRYAHDALEDGRKT